jgi:hypothetical protein
MMVENCDKCGTELESEQYRHQQFRIEYPGDSEERIEGALCSDCFWDLKEWLNTA